MLKKFTAFLTFFACVAFAQTDDWETESSSSEVAEVSSSSIEQTADTSVALSSSSAPTSREVPVRYWVMGDSLEQTAIFVKIENDTVYLRAPNANQQKMLDSIANEADIALQETNGQEVEEDSLEEEVELNKPAEIIMTDAVKDSAARADSLAAAEQAKAESAGSDDFESALENEEKRLKMNEIAKVEEEIRQREIQDSIEAAKENPFIKIYRLNFKRLYNLEDRVMIDLALSNYVVPIPVVVEEKVVLYPPGKANLLVTSSPDSCMLYVNGVALNQMAPDTIKSIKAGKYTVSVMRVLKDTEWWGSKVVHINADSLNKVEIPVLRPSTRLTLNTNPDAVEVYVNDAPTVNTWPSYVTDTIVDGIKPQTQITLHFRKIGYRDTSLTTEVRAFMPNLVYVELESVLDDLPFVEAQQEFDKERKSRRTGHRLLWSSIVPFIAGGVMWYLAERDWSDAADKKHAYEQSAFASKDTDKMVEDNHDLNHSGDIKGIIAAGLGAVGLGLFTFGIVLSF
ncbi:MAG: hypothetical protein HUK21_00200 [Fibrobacteraceae bacterium]|nr:hypothetical protein [Fibrobacteraceae bacterium]